MLWFRQFGPFEFVWMALFVAACAAGFLRMNAIARALNISPTAAWWTKTVIRSLTFVLLMVSLLGPIFGSARREVKSVGKDIMVCVDLSRSMDAFDVQPSRLDKAKFEMKRIVDAFTSDRVGLIIFSSEAFMQCPLTFDQNALHLLIESMNTNLVPNAGTDFGPPLRMAMDKFKTDASNKRDNQRIVILLSDGEDFGEETEDIARDLEDEGIRLFTLGIGTDQGSLIRVPGGYKKDRNGTNVISKINSSALQALAESGGGQYFEINADRNDVPRLINTINSIEGEFRESRQVDVSANRYFYFLLAAALLIILDALIPVKPVRI